MDDHRSSTFKTWRIITYTSIFIGWGMYMLVRRTLSSSMKSLIQHNVYTKDNIGMIASSFSFSYGGSKLFFSFVSDRASPRRIFTTGLLLTGICCLLFPVSTGVVMACVLWFIAGVVQGCGWAPCVIFLKNWYSPSQIGTWWSILSASGNVASALSPLIILYITNLSNWTISYYLIGITTLVLSCAMTYTIKDSPQEIGSKAQTITKKNKSISNTGNEKWYSVFLIFNLWVISFLYACILLLKYGVLSWMQLFLVEARKKPETIAAASVGVFQVGGMAGNIISGYVSDLFMVKRARLCPRAPILLSLSVLLVLALHVYRTSVVEDTPEVIFLFLIYRPIGEHEELKRHNSILLVTLFTMQLLWNAIIFAVGFLIEGMVAIIGLCGMEVAPQNMAGSAHGFVCAVAQVGGVLAGWPFAYVMEQYSWDTAYWVMELFSMIMVLSCLYLLLVMINSRGQEKTKSN